VTARMNGDFDFNSSGVASTPMGAARETLWKPIKVRIMSIKRHTIQSKLVTIGHEIYAPSRGTSPAAPRKTKSPVVFSINARSAHLSQF